MSWRSLARVKNPSAWPCASPAMATRKGAAGLTTGADACDLAFGTTAKERTARIKMNARFIAIPPGISAVNPNIAGLTLPPGASGPALLAITRAVLFRRSGSDLNQIGLISDLRTAGTPASRMNGAALETIDQGADGDGGFDEMADLQGT